ncbi:hypothetical protein ACIHFE_03525 [Streptomyces sp. NPDC052396]|uniref:hypothetical protein n=1 Tax=Streptomyces sp. NPDC052396 TaxID=3365689 RepID=UPI0037D3553F
MGWTVLYIAFGIVALWLLSEVLLQYKARLRWRLLAFGGFLGVVAGVMAASVPVIVVGAVGFAAGQVFVTLSFRRGFAAGWALRRPAAAGNEGGAGEGRAGGRSAGRSGGRSGRRRGRAERGATTDSPAPAAPAAPAALAGEQAADGAPEQPAGVPGVPSGLTGVPEQPTAEYAAVEETSVFGGYDAFQGMPQNAEYTGQNGQFDYAQGQYAAYSDPYIGNRQQGYETYDAYAQPQQSQQPQQQYGTHQQYGTTGYSGDVYAPQHYDMDTPPGGVWVPQQRDTDAAAPPQQPPYPQQPGPGYDEQQHYRY